MELPQQLLMQEYRTVEVVLVVLVHLEVMVAVRELRMVRLELLECMAVEVEVVLHL
jgi:hypothetical protein